MSAALDAAVANWRSKRGPLAAAIIARNTAQNVLNAAGDAFDALNIPASTDAQIGAVLVTLATRQAEFDAAKALVELRQDELAAAREAMRAQAKIDAGV